MDWTGWIDPAEKPSPLRAPAVLKMTSEMYVASLTLMILEFRISTF